MIRIDGPRGDARAGSALFGSWSDIRTSVVIALCCLIVFNANGRAISAGDAFPARYQPFAILKYGTATLDPIEALVLQGREPPANWRAPHPGAAHWIVPTSGGHLVSLYSVVLPVLIAPLYVPAVSYVSMAGWTDQRIDLVARVMEKATASLLASLSAALLYLVLRRRTTRSTALLLTIAYAFGTSTWVISSQALWQHGLGQLLLVALMLVLTRPCDSVFLAVAAGALCALIAGNRPADAVLVAPLGIYALFWAGRRAPLVMGAALVPAGLLLLYNVSVAGAPGGGYQLVGRAGFFRHSSREGLAGLLFSPTRGLFVFSPFLLFLVLSWRRPPSDPGERRLTLAMIVGVILQVVLYSRTDWRGGISWGPRFLTDLLPMLIWMLVPVVSMLRRRGHALFVAAVLVAIAIEAVGAFAYTGVTDLPIFAATSGPDRLRAAWDWRNAPFIAPLRRGSAPAELLTPMRGAIDTIDVDGHATDTSIAGQRLVASGWALAGRATPLQAAILVDGRDTIAVGAFSDRADVRAALPGAGPSGWRIAIDTSHLTPGVHRLALLVWGSENGEAYFLHRRTVRVQAPAPARAPASDGRTPWNRHASTATARARVREHQQTAGYWLTMFTDGTRFERPHAEMNTYLTSLLVDLLSPLGASDLDDSLTTARRHLTAQIEASGLVRYHGLPDGPGIGTLGCAITPDTDDTALVWRIAPGTDRPRLDAALAVIEGYRTSDGLYRTWLAPRDAYQCLDPGTDPNPPDIAIQMHLLQLLLEERPPAGRALCDALRRHLDDDRIWVYYKRSPLVPMLRTVDLERAGCALDLPAERTRTAVADQDVWVTLVGLLTRASSGRTPRPDVTEIDRVLRELAADDFARLRANPPLLYHNDVTGTVPRYYWSEDVGYALWLRLARAVEP